LIVYDRGLDDKQYRSLLAYLSSKYTLSTSTSKPTTPELLAWASLCHVLLNTNEFIYVD
jgi:hypothetical protein